MTLDINEIRRISREAKKVERRKAKEKIDTAWESKVMPSIEKSITFHAKDGKDYVEIYIYDRFWELGNVRINSEEDFSDVLNLVDEYFEDFKVGATYDDLISKRKIIISWEEDTEEEMLEEEKEEDDE